MNLEAALPPQLSREEFIRRAKRLQKRTPSSAQTDSAEIIRAFRDRDGAI